ncbi:MAG TPA: TonB-dependent receptor [Dyella sp.]|uniref:TonB-dependent receptor plug domain-containing protein n=1 Tax=Dyella sp. TaxID=1869338 RepID=UPI002F9306D6
MKYFENSKLAVAVRLGLAMGALAFSASVFAQDASGAQASQESGKKTEAATNDSPKDVKKLDQVVVTGSLIPISQIETATPTFTITSDDMKARGFSTVAEALQQSSFATGSVQGAQFSQGFTPGAQTLSLFGLPIGFTKYLIDGRPMGNFPALYNGSDSFNSISGIPADLVDHIDILPGGQSSLYGSDAIAGVINIVLKKNVDRPSIDYRYGWTSDGGGQSNRLSFADSFHWNKLNVVYGVQLEKQDAIWASQRSLSSHYFNGNPKSPAIAGRDYLVNSATGAGYLFEDPNNCANVAGQFNGGEGLRHRAGSGDYCGSFNSPGYRTMQDPSKTGNVYAHGTFDVTPDTQLYGDVLFNYSKTKWNSGAGYMWWGSAADFGHIYDPNLDDFVDLQHAFSPEEVGGYDRIATQQTEKSLMYTLGANGVWDQNWNWDLGFTHSQDHLDVSDYVRYADKIDAYFEKNVLGDYLGEDPYGFGYSSYAINYDAFYRPVSRADFDSFTGREVTHAKTYDNMLRFQLTNGSLFALPGGDAGIAIVAEGGNQGWDYQPSAQAEAGNLWGTGGVSGSGHRSRYALTTEFRAPLTTWLTIDASGRYDGYNVLGTTIAHGTYNLGFEIRPFDTLLLRGKYGTAFKAPNISDQFQGPSAGYLTGFPDYLNCGRLGFTPDTIDQCKPLQYGQAQIIASQSGNKDLQPITAKVWSYGFVWSPIERMKISVDYLHWDISNEVNTESASGLSLDEYRCDIGMYAMDSGTCTNAFAKIVRNPVTPDEKAKGLLGTIDTINTPKVNVSNEKVNALSAEFAYQLPTARFGTFGFNLSYSDVLKHEYQDYPGDDYVNYLTSPDWSQDFKTKVNGSVSWITPDDNWATTVYFNRLGATPNYEAQLLGEYDASRGARKYGAWITYNASIAYKGFKNIELSFLVNNVFNKMPPHDNTYLGTEVTPWNQFNYNIYGRTMYIEANYKF